MKSGVSAEFAQRLADLLDGCVEPAIELHESIDRPKCLLKLLARDHLTRSLEQQSQYAEGLLLQLDLTPLFLHLTGREVHPEWTEANDPAVGGGCCHVRACRSGL